MPARQIVRTPHATVCWRMTTRRYCFVILFFVRAIHAPSPSSRLRWCARTRVIIWSSLRFVDSRYMRVTFVDVIRHSRFIAPFNNFLAVIRKCRDDWFAWRRNRTGQETQKRRCLQLRAMAEMRRKIKVSVTWKEIWRGGLLPGNCELVFFPWKVILRFFRWLRVIF